MAGASSVDRVQRIYSKLKTVFVCIHGEISENPASLLALLKSLLFHLACVLLLGLSEVSI
jgi:hypothetical protein